MASHRSGDSPISESTDDTVIVSGPPTSVGHDLGPGDDTGTRTAATIASDKSLQPQESVENVATEQQSKKLQPRRDFSFFNDTVIIRIPAFLLLTPETQPDERLQTLHSEKIEDYPAGYPRFAATINSDTNFSVYRRFGTIRNRLLLYKQQEIARLEAELLQLDREDAESNEQSTQKRLKSWRIDRETNSKRMELLPKIDVALREYDDLIQRERESLAIPKPNKRNYLSIVNWLWNYRQLVRNDTQFLNPSDDFVILAAEQDSNFHVRMEKLVRKLPESIWKYLFTTEAQREKTSTEGIYLLSSERINILIRIVVSILTVSLLIIPICILFNIDYTNAIRTVIICAFVMIFPIIISIFARPRNHELINATAAYAAVLVVFLGNLVKDTSD